MTIMSGSFKGLIDWNEIAGQTSENSFLVYAGPEDQLRTHGMVVAWNHVKNILPFG